VLFGF